MANENEVKTGEVLKFGERTTTPKDNAFRMRLSDEQLAEVNRVARRYDRTMSDVVRACIDIALPDIEKTYRELTRKKRYAKLD